MPDERSSDAPPTAAPRSRRRRGDLAPNPALWSALGEGVLLATILEDFYTRVYADPRLAPFFEGVTRQRAIEKQHAFLRDIFSGSHDYFGDRPRNAHHWMVISDELFDYREALMEACLRRAGLAEAHVAAWRATEEVFRKQLVKAAPVPKKLGGVAVPFEGYAEVLLEVGTLCDGCEAAIDVGHVARYHRRTGRTYCLPCAAEREAAEGVA